ncbi:hypothetical protein [Mucilaginibacter sp.]|uniref:hypothetical protein n=1 Tax=Mucilaginibacter sp. TaxID=1882438 RepID=UPI0025EFE1E5|nr:hypothetical protein [Mucilaginibacter sp.]
MKPKLLFCLFLLMGLRCYAEKANIQLPTDTTIHHKKIKKQKVFTLAEFERLRKLWKPSYDHCIFTNQYTVKQRLKKYPFSKAVKILAISYHALEVPNEEVIIDGDSTKHIVPPHNIGLQVIKDSLDFSNLLEVKILDQMQINRLTNIIYNTDFRKNIGFSQTGGASCYEPRNAFIFFDRQGKVYDYLEICFGCKHYSSKSGKLDIGEFCTQKYDILRKYFKSVGINYGTKCHMLED